jgi:hypothetical protein
MYHLYQCLGPAFIGHPQATVEVVDSDLLVRLPQELCVEVRKEYKESELKEIQ